ncbi:MAG TPA: hypothetical protein VHE35_13155 [Kofleriaceae bacterium]|nr:hypothetical protein [Kofleriaceae bacterium]
MPILAATTLGGAFHGVAWAGPTVGPTEASDGSNAAYTDTEPDRVHLRLTLDYRLDIRRSAIRREMAGRPGTDPTDAEPVGDDLVFEGARHTVIPRLELDLFRDLAVTVAMPYVLSDQRSLELDQRDTPCIFGAGGTCVDRTTSSTIRDGILPAAGFDGQNGGTGFASDDPMVFRGPKRHGIDQLHAGLVWMPMNQRRDDTKPTWKLGVEGRFAIGKIMSISRDDLAGSTGVGRGVHEIRLWTSMTRRLGWAEPTFEAWWMAPFATTSKSPFASPGFGARNTGPSQEAGVRFNLDAYAVDQGNEGARLSLGLGGHVIGHFEGRQYTEMWEVFSLAGESTTSGPLVLDADPVASGVQPLDHPGITNIENYLELAARVHGRIEVGRRLRVTALVEAGTETEHVITATDAGVDLPTCSASRTTGCETDDNELVTPGTREVNPLSVPRIDLIGHRYHVDDVLTFLVGAQLELLF